MARTEKVIMTNMCMVFSENRVLVQDKRDDDYSGITFPGGHVERGESFTNAVIREVWEETGLKISEPKLCGIKDWMKDEEQNIHKICHAVVKEVSTGKEFEDTQEIILGRAAPDEISTEAMTTLILQGKKKWLIVQSTPSVSGSYALNSDRTINNIWYKSENGEIICTEDILKLQKDTTYQFLITLK